MEKNTDKKRTEHKHNYRVSRDSDGFPIYASSKKSGIKTLIECETCSKTYWKYGKGDKMSHSKKDKYEVKSVFTMHYSDGSSDKLTDTSYGYFETLQEARECIQFMSMFNASLNSEGSKISFWINKI